MALDATQLSSLIVAQMTASFGVTDPVELKKLADAIATAVVTHITTSAVVNVTGVTPGPGAATGTVS